MLGSILAGRSLATLDMLDTQTFTESNRNIEVSDAVGRQDYVAARTNLVKSSEECQEERVLPLGVSSSPSRSTVYRGALRSWVSLFSAANIFLFDFRFSLRSLASIAS